MQLSHLPLGNIRLSIKNCHKNFVIVITIIDETYFI